VGDFGVPYILGLERQWLVRFVQVLVEGPNPKAAGQAYGRSRHNKLVFFDGDGEKLQGELVHVHVDRVHAFSLFGDMV
jgi:tRNA-2-methylthio-N6-dimethylallyladenosine synthase